VSNRRIIAEQKSSREKRLCLKFDQNITVRFADGRERLYDFAIRENKAGMPLIVVRAEPEYIRLKENSFSYWRDTSTVNDIEILAELLIQRSAFSMALLYEYGGLEEGSLFLVGSKNEGSQKISKAFYLARIPRSIFQIKEKPRVPSFLSQARKHARWVGILVLSGVAGYNTNLTNAFLREKGIMDDYHRSLPSWMSTVVITGIGLIFAIEITYVVWEFIRTKRAKKRTLRVEDEMQNYLHEALRRQSFDDFWKAL